MERSPLRKMTTPMSLYHRRLFGYPQSNLTKPKSLDGIVYSFDPSAMLLASSIEPLMPNLPSLFYLQKNRFSSFCSPMAQELALYDQSYQIQHTSIDYSPDHQGGGKQVLHMIEQDGQWKVELAPTSSRPKPSIRCIVLLRCCASLRVHTMHESSLIYYPTRSLVQHGFYINKDSRRYLYETLSGVI